MDIISQLDSQLDHETRKVIKSMDDISSPDVTRLRIHFNNGLNIFVLGRQIQESPRKLFTIAVHDDNGRLVKGMLESGDEPFMGRCDTETLIECIKKISLRTTIG
ncbi:MAG: hypothetical protein HQM11_16515 [SAR324 cluster bacterium]|nr:hypothetical protein [SAR324 cluster bacterium]